MPYSRFLVYSLIETKPPEPPELSSSSLTKSQTATAVGITAHSTSTVVRAVVTSITRRLPGPIIKNGGATAPDDESGSIASLGSDLGLIALRSTKSIVGGGQT